MPRDCATCIHPEHAAIEAAMAAGASGATIESLFVGVSESSAVRHKRNHVPQNAAPEAGNLLVAADEMIAAARQERVFDQYDEVEVVYIRSLAAALGQSPANPVLLREWRATFDHFRPAPPPAAGEQEELASLIARVSPLPLNNVRNNVHKAALANGCGKETADRIAAAAIAGLWEAPAWPRVVNGKPVDDDGNPVPFPEVESGAHWRARAGLPPLAGAIETT